MIIRKNKESSFKMWLSRDWTTCDLIIEKLTYNIIFYKRFQSTLKKTFSNFVWSLFIAKPHWERWKQSLPTSSCCHHRVWGLSRETLKGLVPEKVLIFVAEQLLTHTKGVRLAIHFHLAKKVKVGKVSKDAFWYFSSTNATVLFWLFPIYAN